MNYAIKKLEGYGRRISYEWVQWRKIAAAKSRERAFDAWLNHLSAKPPDVLLGANFDSSGGVRHHIHAIRRYSSLDIEFAPNEKLRRSVSAYQMVHDFGNRFLEFAAAGVKVTHSHVSPWFIEWCYQRQKTGVPWVHTYHLNYYPEHSTGRLAPWQEEINTALINVARHADVRLSVSRWQVEELSDKHGISTQYLPNGVDVAICDAADANRFIKKTGLKDFVLYVGRNAPVKNPTDFVRLANRMPDQQFVMIGGGLSNEAIYVDWEIEVPPNLFIVGALTHMDVQDAIAACAVLVVTSKREGLPTLVMEGMAQSKTVVVPDEKGCMEVIDYGNSGLIYQRGNIEDLVVKTIQGLSDRQLGELARQRVLAEYDWRVVSPQLTAVYQDIFS